MDRTLIEKFIEVTGESEATAEQYLTVAEGNMESAISLLFEGGGCGAPEVNPPAEEPECSVRPPILPTQEILVPPEMGCSIPRSSSNVFDRFRDFNVETRRQEEEMTQIASGLKKNSQKKSRRLEDLFRPPNDILFLGTFLEAREYAKSKNRWLLINVQNPQEFACQVLNRDVWSNQQVREIIKDHFVLWQVISDTSEGKRYIDFYNVAGYPYLSIIDPRTGECMRMYNHITVDSLTLGLNDMLSAHASPESAPHETSCSDESQNSSDLLSTKRISPNPLMRSNTSPTKKLRTTEGRNLDFGINDGDANTSVSSTSVANSSNSTIISKRSRIYELDAKIQSRKVAEEKGESSNQDQLPTNKIESENNAPSLRLCLRLPNGSKETLSMVASETIQHFFERMEAMGYSLSEYTFIIPFPRTVIGDLSPDLRLSDSILFPSNTIFISKIN